MAARGGRGMFEIVSDLEDMAATLKAACYGLNLYVQGLSGPKGIQDRDHRILALFYERVEDEAAGLEELAKDLRATLPRPAIGGA